MAARNIFQMTPVDFAAAGKSITQRSQGVPFSDLARRTNVPVNLLMAAAQTDPHDPMGKALKVSQMLAEPISQGIPADQALKSIMGPAADPLIARAYDIADSMFPDAAQQSQQQLNQAPEPQMGRLHSAGRKVVQNAISLFGSTLKGSATMDASRARHEKVLDEAMQKASGGRARAGYAAAYEIALEAANARAQEYRAKGEEPPKDVLDTINTLQGIINDHKKDAAIPADQRPAYAAGQAIQDYAAQNWQGDPAYKGEFWADKFASGAGSMAGFLAATIATAGTGTAFIGSASQAADLYDEAKSKGASEEDALKAADLGAFIGSTEVIPILHGLNKIMPGAGSQLVRGLRKIVENAGEEAAQEAFQQLTSNMVAQGIYDPNRKVMEGVGENALIGGMLGGGVAAIGAARTPKEAPPTPGPEPLQIEAQQPLPQLPPPDNGIENQMPPSPLALPAPADGQQAQASPAGQAASGSPDTAGAPGAETFGIPSAPGSNTSTEPKTVIDELADIAHQTDPTGDIAAARQAPKQATQSTFPDYKTGQKVELVDPDGIIHDAVFLGENSQGGVRVRIEGQPIDMSGQEFAAAVYKDSTKGPAPHDGATPAPTPSAQATQKVDPVSVFPTQAKPDEPLPPEYGPRAEPPAPKTIMGQNANTLNNNIHKVLGPTRDPLPKSAAEAFAAAEQFRRNVMKVGGGWSAASTKKYQRMMTTAMNMLGENQSSADHTVQTAAKGKPFPSEKNAINALKRRKLNPADYHISPVTGGVVALRKSAFDIQEAGQPGTARPATAPAQKADMPTPQEIARAGQATETNPSDGQKHAENYKTGKIQWKGMTFSIENPVGSTRSGTSQDGKPWSVTMKDAHYGRLLKTKGADGDHVDAFFLHSNGADYNNVFVINQRNLKTGRFDEHKLIIGPKNEEQALKTYRGAFTDNKDRVMSIERLSADQAVDWLKNGDTTKPFIRKKPAKKRPARTSVRKAPPKQSKKSAQATASEAKSAPKTNPRIEANRKLDARPDGEHLARFVNIEQSPAKGGFVDLTGKTDLILTKKTPGNDARRAVLDHSSADAVEHSIVLGPSGNILSWGKGEERNTGEPASWKKLDEDGRGFVVHHNHLGDSPLSTTDVVSAINRPGISAIYAHTKDGKYMFRPSGEYTLKKSFASVMAARIKASHKFAYEKAKSDTTSSAELALQYSNDYLMLLPMALERAGAGIFMADGPAAKRIAAGEAYWQKHSAHDVVGMLADSIKPFLVKTSDSATRQTADTRHVGDVSPLPARVTLPARTNTPAANEDNQNARPDRPANAVRPAERVESVSSKSAQHSEKPADKPDKGTVAPRKADNTGEGKRSGKQDQAVKKPYDTGLLNDEERARLDALKKRFTDKIKTETRSGLDPELVSIAVEMASLYVKAGARKIKNLIGAMISDLGITYEQAQPYARVAYNDARDNLDLAGEDVSDMDSSADVLDQIRQWNKSGFPLNEEAASGSVNDNPKATKDENNGKDTQTQPDTGAERGDGRAGKEPRKADNAADGQRSAEPGQETGGSNAGTRTQGSEPRTDALGDGKAGRDRRIIELTPPPARSPQPSTKSDYIIPPGGLKLPRGEKTRAKLSLDAIRRLKMLDETGQSVRLEDMEILAKYGGAGTLAGALPRSDGSVKYPDLHEELKSLLTEREMQTLSRTSQYAFYTAESVLRAMWNGVRHLGLKGNIRVYEPGMGVGGFIGTMPRDHFAGAKYQGIELDHITAAIARKLYGAQNITQGDFIEQVLPQNFYDLVIGNPPFASTRIKADPKYPQNFMLHDYFFAKSLDSVRPGGLLMFITSAGTMNKRDSKARKYMAERADLLGAIRLPNTAFVENGTQVTTDIIVLRKREDGQKPAGPAWIESIPQPFPDGEGNIIDLPVNEYFVNNEDMILGKQGAYDTLTAGKRIGVIPREGSDLAKDLAAAMERLAPGAATTSRPATSELDARDSESTEKKEGSYYIKDGKLYQHRNGAGEPVKIREGRSGGGISKTDADRIHRLIVVRNALRDVYEADLAENTEAAKKARARLNKVYDGFVKKHGPIAKRVERQTKPTKIRMERARIAAMEEARMTGQPFDVGSFDPGPMIEAGETITAIANAREKVRARLGEQYSDGSFDPATVPPSITYTYPNTKAFQDDPEVYRLMALEKYDEDAEVYEKGPVFSKPVVSKPPSEPEINSPEDALFHVVNMHGTPDIGKIADLLGMSEDEAMAELGDSVFNNPDGEVLEIASKYLSGNIRNKLHKAREAARNNPDYEKNVAALEKAMPAPIPIEDIKISFGHFWFPSVHYSQWAKSLGLELEVSYDRFAATWKIERASSTGVLAKEKYGMKKLPFNKIIEALMNNKPVTVKDKVTDANGNERLVANQKDTEAANEIADELRRSFSDWMISDEKRRDDLAKLYNQVFNSTVPPKYDGKWLTTPGIASDWQWRPHQQSVVARIILSGNTYMAHAVGAGKTSAMIGAAMELKRLGIKRKSMFVVPKHMITQFATEFYQQYPLAKVAVADERRFHTNRRKQFVADVAMNDYDAIIITHSAFQMIPPSEKERADAVKEHLEQLRAVHDSADGDNVSMRAQLSVANGIAATLGIKDASPKAANTRKKIEAILEAAEQKIRAATGNMERKDGVFTFEQMGVDMLFVDEAHMARKLSFATSMGTVKGVSPDGSQRAMDLYIKLRSLEKKYPGNNAVFASGTPITNTMAEAYSISRFLQMDALKARGIENFDAWAGLYGETVTDLEPTPGGDYKQVARFSKFINVPELSVMMREVMDVVTSKDLDKYVTRPALKSGKRELVSVEPTEEFDAYQEIIKERIKKIQGRNSFRAEKGQDILLSVINDARLAAIDMRLVDSTANGRGSKLERLITNVHRIWKNTHKTPLYDVKSSGYEGKPSEYGPAAQIIFSVQGINGTKHNPSFGTHRHIKASLIRMGVPADQIVISEDLKNDVQKKRAYNDLNSGKKRIFIASSKFFTGMNAQERLIAVHNLDPLWFPADDEQRNGRALRQGNRNKEIEIIDYTTKGSYDEQMFGMMARKGKFIEAFYKGDPTMREMEDLGEASVFEQAMAITARDPRVLELIELKQKRDKLRRARMSNQQKVASLKSAENNALDAIARAENTIEQLEKADKTAPVTKGSAFEMQVGTHNITERSDAGKRLLEGMTQALNESKSGDQGQVASIGPFPISMSTTLADQSASFYVHISDTMVLGPAASSDAVGLVRRIEQLVSSIPHRLKSARDKLTAAQKELAQTRDMLANPPRFDREGELNNLEKRVSELELSLESSTQKSAPKEDVTKDRALGSFVRDESGALHIPNVSPSKWLTSASQLASDAITDAMNGSFSTLAIVPLRPLLKELGKHMPSAGKYLAIKVKMDALRNNTHARIDEIIQHWIKLGRTNRDANIELMDIMHTATLEQTDPSKDIEEDEALIRNARRVVKHEKPSNPMYQWAKDTLRKAADRRRAHATLQKRYRALPRPFQKLFVDLRDEYTRLADDFEQAILDNIDKSMQATLRREMRAHRAEMKRIKDEGLSGDEKAAAVDAADRRLAQAKARGGWALKAKLAKLRSVFENNRVQGPYFPLARFGQYFVTLRDADDKVVSFSRFETARAQRRFIDKVKKEGKYSVEHGVLQAADTKLRRSVDPTFVAEVQDMVAGLPGADQVMDSIWQRWLETLPDMSIRKTRIHRKGRAGYAADALRAFSHHMFHGVHQLARLKYGIDLENAIDDARDESRHAPNKERAGAVIDELERRHQFVMNPKGGPVAAMLNSLGFVWYLGATPASAIVNISQTSIMGIPILGAAFDNMGKGVAAKQLARAARDFTNKKASVLGANITPDERQAMERAYNYGVVDRSQAHDLASVAETGIEYSGFREKWMKRISFMFHHAERFNREVTFLAAYRMARGSGMKPGEAFEKASDLTWKTHFDYQNNARPRVLQGDVPKVLFLFRQFTINMLWRVFRDAHQSLKGATKAERREARAQLVGVSLMLFAHAGVRGMVGYGLLMTLLGMFFPGDDDDMDARLQDLLLVEGDNIGAKAWNYTMGMALNGVPGHITGTHLSERIGMPNLWFRGADRDLEGMDLMNHYVSEMLGPVFGIAGGFFRAAQYASEGNFWRAGETAAPKALRDMSKAVRWSVDGVKTSRGDTLIEHLPPHEAIAQAIGFTPAPVAERYRVNTLMKKWEMRITRERGDLQSMAADELRSDGQLSQATLDDIAAFNRKYPDYPITTKTLRSSTRGKIRASAQNEFGVRINPRLNRRIRDAAPKLVYQ